MLFIIFLMDYIFVKGARQHNLKGIDVKIPRNKFVVITGVSGSGKSSLAFDTIYAEGQRRYVECLSAYARQFLELMPRPDVDSIEGLSPAISIDQKGARWNPRSTVATSSEIYDYLRVLFARAGKPYCPRCKIPIEAQTVQRITDSILSLKRDLKAYLFAPIIRCKKGEHKNIIEAVRRKGFSRVRIDGKIYDLMTSELPQLDPKKKHTIEILVDRFITGRVERERLTSSIETACDVGDGLLTLEVEENRKLIFSTKFACPGCSFSYQEISPRLFSFNSPYGACPKCSGLGSLLYLDDKLLVNPELPIQKGAIRMFKKGVPSWFTRFLKRLASDFKFELSKILETPFEELPDEIKNAILYGWEGEEGLVPYLWSIYEDEGSWEIEPYISATECPECGGSRLREEALSVKVAEKSIWDVVRMTVDEAYDFFSNLKLEGQQMEIAERILKEVKSRIKFLKDVGLGYLQLSRGSSTLSGGEAQRLKLATQVGSGLTGVLYVLDEPTCGLHPRDIRRLISTLKRLKELGNTVLVIEHDRDTIESSDLVIDLGPGAGIEGGEVVFEGTPQELSRNGSEKSLTSLYMSGALKIEVPRDRKKPDGKYLVVSGARGNNLKNITVKFPIGLFICVTGVSGSGKSSLVQDTLYKALARKLYGSKELPLEHDFIEGGYIDRALDVNQSPIGRTPRSNPATYTGIFTPIRDLFASLPESRMRGYRPGRFSFNVPGGRCEECEGQGLIKVEMHFLPDVYITCKACGGKRYNRDTLEVRYRGKNIHDVLEMTVDEALEFFSQIPYIAAKLKLLQEVGLGYIKLGQPATTLSGGEAQRIKLARELVKKATGRTLYILDEPTTGLHFDDIKKLIKVLLKLRDGGNTVIVIEHNLDVIKVADWIIDLGPEGGEDGGYLVAEGPPEELVKVEGSWTGTFLRKVLQSL